MYNAVFAIALLLPASVLMALHWFPWPDAINRPLHRLESYALGVGMINGTAIALLRFVGANGLALDADLAILLVVCCSVSGGGGTLLAWGIDYLVARRRGRQRIERRRLLDLEGESAHTFLADNPATD